ncbi:MAG: hypothetical protein QOI38_3138 [Sphingomonadales bacterium]|jgi:hypothetical protein|nr:hypothetical protein [Sphingomonadales bacterium]
MDARLKLPAFAALILAGVAGGFALGESAIDQINPLYFQGAAAHPRDRGAALDPNALQAQSPRFADLYGWDEGQAARAADCFGCPAVAARDAYAQAPVIEYAAAETPWRDAAPAYLPEPEAEPADPAEEAVQPVDVALYAGFQIEEKPAEAEPVDQAAGGE